MHLQGFQKNALVLFVAFLLTSCGEGLFGPKVTVLEMDNTNNYAKTENVEFFFTKEADPSHVGTLPSDLTYKLIATVRVKGELPSRNGSGNGFMDTWQTKKSYKNKALNQSHDMAAALENKAKELGADTVIITDISHVREQRVDAVSYSLNRKVVYGPWFNVPIWTAKLVRVRP